MLNLIKSTLFYDILAKNNLKLTTNYEIYSRTTPRK